MEQGVKERKVVQSTSNVRRIDLVGRSGSLEAIVS